MTNHGILLNDCIVLPGESMNKECSNATAKMPPARPIGLTKDKAHDISRLNLWCPITVRIIAAPTDSQLINSITIGNLDMLD